MEIAKEELAQIKDLLRKNPRGMNVTEIAKVIGMSRITTAKYLDMLVLTGHVDLKEWGPSKVYFLSQRMPISAMLSLSSDFIIVLDRDLNIINVNGKFLEFSGMSREELFYKKIQLFAIPSMFKPSFMPRIKEAIEGKESAVEAEYERDGKTYYVNVKLIPIVFDEGEKGVTILIEDITERKMAEEDLMARENRLKKILDLTPVPMIVSDGRSQKTLYLNAKFTETFGYTIEDMPSAYEWFLLAYPDKEYRADILENWAKDREGALKYKTDLMTKESTVRCKDGSTRVVIITVSSIDEQIIIVFHDITKRKQAEEALRSAEEKYRNLVESVSDIIWETGSNLALTYVNPQLYKTLGVKPEEIVGKTVMDLMTPEEGARFLKVILPFVAARKPFSRLVFKFVGIDNEEIVIEVSGNPRFDANGKYQGYRGVARDISSASDE